MPKRLRHHPGVAGLDEAGRGPLAGPVVAAAVILPKGFDLEGLDDSKKLTALKREELAIRIKEKAAWAVSIVCHEEVDRLNILWASMEGMCRALDSLPIRPERALVDGNTMPPNPRFPCRIETVIDGDAKYACIAAASIIAKTTRDELMRGYGSVYPGYGFESHFGYAAPEHREALRRLGPCPIHRRSFYPVQEAMQACLTFDE